MPDKDIIIGRVINVTGMIGVSAGIVLLAFAIVLLLFRRGFGFNVGNLFHLMISLSAIADLLAPSYLITSSALLAPPATQHSILKGKDGVFGDASRLFSRLYGIRENRA